MRSLAFHALFFFSGAAALTYQIVWTRMLTIGLGHEVSAVLSVVAAFMAGMTLGAWFLARPIARAERPGRWFAWLEIIIGMWGILTPFVIPIANETALQIIGPASPSSWQWVGFFFIPALVLLPATFAMGATFAAAERFLRSMAHRPSVGAVYASNTSGAVLGVLLATFFLMPTLGLRNTSFVCAAANLTCGLAATCLARKTSRPSIPAGTISARLKWSLLITGFLGIGYEVIGIRLLSNVLENTVHTFALALATFLLGIALGGGAYQRGLWRRAAEECDARLFGGAAVSCAVGLWAMFQAREIFDAVASEIAVVGAAFLLPAVFMGALFTHLAQKVADFGLPTGRALALNTLGAAFAPAVFGVLLFPNLGPRAVSLSIVAGYLALMGNVRRHLPLVLCAGIIAAPVWWMRDEGWHAKDERIIAFDEGVTASVAVLEGADGHRTLRINKRFQQGGTAAANAEYRHAHIPLLLHPNPRSALFLGLGTGITLGAATKHPALQIDGVELVPEVLQAMPAFAPHNFGAWTNPAVTLVTADARRFVQTTTNRYDVITADLFHPAMDGAGMLYTGEHFGAIQSLLTTNGLFCQWLPLYQLDEELVRIIARTFIDVFPHSEAWLLRFNIDTPVLGLISFPTQPNYFQGWIESRLQTGELREQISSLALADSPRFFGNRLLDADSLARFCKSAVANTDDKPIVIFRAPQVKLHSRTPYDSLVALLQFPRGRPDDGRLAAYMDARDTYLFGLIDEAEGREGKSIDGFVASARMSPDFTPGYARCITISSLLARSRPLEARRLLERLIEAQPAQPLAKEMLIRLFEP